MGDATSLRIEAAKRAARIALAGQSGAAAQAEALAALHCDCTRAAAEDCAVPARVYLESLVRALVDAVHQTTGDRDGARAMLNSAFAYARIRLPLVQALPETRNAYRLSAKQREGS